MIYKDAILLLLIGHFLADYYFQSDASVKNQNKEIVLRHCLIYLFTLLTVILPLFNGTLFIAALFIAISHAIIDMAKFYLKQRKGLTYIQSVVLYIFDQVLHLFIILAAGLYFIINSTAFEYVPILKPIVESVFPLMNISSPYFLSWLLILLVIFKPASITIRTVLDHFEPNHKKEADFGIKNAGALIGIFERLIILMMLYVGQYSAIGFVLTAKSIARYNRISEDPQFAEYYLLGTLLSSLIIIISFHLIF